MTIPVDYVDIRDTLVDSLNAVNTTTATYDLSTGLTKRITGVVKHDLFINPKFMTDYPLISIRLVSKEETPEDTWAKGIGRFLTLETEVYCIYQDFIDAEKNLWDMVRNVETNIRAIPTLGDYSTTSVQITRTNIGSVYFVDNIGPEDAFNKSARIDLTIEGYITALGVLTWDDTTGAGDWNVNLWG